MIEQIMVSVVGYWKDDKSEFGGTICSYDCTPEGYDDDEIFYYGMDEQDIREAITAGEDTSLDFVITDIVD